MVQKERGGGCGGVAVLGKDCGITGAAPVYIRRYRLFFIVSCLFSLFPVPDSPFPLLPPIPVPPASPARPLRGYKSTLRRLRFKAAVATSVDLLICEPTATYPRAGVHLEGEPGVRGAADKRERASLTSLWFSNNAG